MRGKSLKDQTFRTAGDLWSDLIQVEPTVEFDGGPMSVRLRQAYRVAASSQSQEDAAVLATMISECAELGGMEKIRESKINELMAWFCSFANALGVRELARELGSSIAIALADVVAWQTAGAVFDLESTEYVAAAIYEIWRDAMHPESVLQDVSADRKHRVLLNLRLLSNRCKKYPVDPGKHDFERTRYCEWAKLNDVQTLLLRHDEACIALQAVENM